MGITRTGQDLTRLHTALDNETASENSFHDPECLVIATEFHSSGSGLIESENPSDHLYDQVGGKREKKKAHKQQQCQSFEDEGHLYDEVDKKKALSIITRV